MVVMSSPFQAVGRGWRVPAGRADNTAMGLVQQAPDQVTIARLVHKQVVAARADESPRRHEASLREGQALTATTTGIIAA
jgi:hypothetical protein